MDKILIILIIPSMLVLYAIPINTSIASVMAATTTSTILSYMKGYSHHYNKGFSDGYNGISMPQGKHTQDYLNGYKDGVSSIRYNHGYVEGFNGLPFAPGKHTQNYTDGYKSGMQQRTIDLPFERTIPIHTNDMYKDFYNGYHDGAVATDNDDSSGNGIGFHGCPATSYSKEYCKGYEAGYNDEADFYL